MQPELMDSVKLLVDVEGLDANGEPTIVERGTEGVVTAIHDGRYRVSVSDCLDGRPVAFLETECYALSVQPEASLVDPTRPLPRTTPTVRFYG